MARSRSVTGLSFDFCCIPALFNRTNVIVMSQSYSPDNTIRSAENKAHHQLQYLEQHAEADQPAFPVLIILLWHRLLRV